MRCIWLICSNPAAAVEGAILGNFEPDVHKTSSKESKPLDSFSLVVPARSPLKSKRPSTWEKILADSQNFTRDLANEPANLMTPMVMADRARAMCSAEAGLECEVLDQDRMRQLGMGSLLGVAQGSAEPPALIILRYTPAVTQSGAPNSADHLGLVGKGVTFDTGGVSIKPAGRHGEDEVRHVGRRCRAWRHARHRAAKTGIPVTALVPAVENMVGSRAQRPGDIVTSLDGKTIEVLNTDAEGRLISDRRADRTRSASGAPIWWTLPRSPAPS